MLVLYAARVHSNINNNNNNIASRLYTIIIILQVQMSNLS